jgi:hypothetical protein
MLFLPFSIIFKFILKVFIKISNKNPIENSKAANARKKNVKPNVFRSSIYMEHIKVRQYKVSQISSEYKK